MLRRLVPLTLLATSAVVAVSSAASAAPPAQAPVAVSHLDSYYASALVPLQSGQTALVSLSRYRYTGDMAWHDSVLVEVGSQCPDGRSLCDASTSGGADVDDSQVRFGANLDEASVTVPVTLTTWSGWYSSSTRDTTLSVVFTGTGSTTRASYGSTTCQESGDPGCHSRREEADRAADVRVALGDDTGTGTGTLFHGLGMDIAPPSVVRAGSAY